MYHLTYTPSSVPSNFGTLEVGSCTKHDPTSSVPNVTTVTNVPKMTKNDHIVPVFGSVHFYMGFWRKKNISLLKIKMANGRHIARTSGDIFSGHQIHSFIKTLNKRDLPSDLAKNA